MSKNICKTCGRVLEAGEVHAKDSSGKCVTRIIARSVPANAVVTAEEGEQHTLDVGDLTSLATAVKLAHWNADTKSTEHAALGELYEALEAATDRFVEAWLGKHKGAVTSEVTLELKGKSLGEVCDEAAKAVEGYRQKVGAGCEDLLNILADMDEALNKARYLLKAKGEDMSERAKVTAVELPCVKCTSGFPFVS
jgi:DNA-binding ferritin-like protein